MSEFQLLIKKGAVSKKVVKNMARSVRLLAKTDFGIGVTGIAGPSIGTSKEPLGTVFIAIDSKVKKICKKFNFTGNRTTVRQKTALKSLELLKRLIT